MKTAFFAFLLLCCQVQAAIYYVRIDGNDKNVGLEDSASGAWATLAKANQAAQAGDTIVIGPGEFNQSRIITVRDGTQEAPIVWRGSGKTTIIRTTAWLPYAFVVKHDNIQFHGLRFVNSSLNIYYGADAGLINECVFEQPNHSHIYFEGGMETHMREWVIRNCEFREASDQVSAQPCIRLCGSNHLFENNYFTSTLGGTDVFHYLGKGTVIRGNTFENWGVRAGSRNHVDLIQSFTNNAANVAEDLLFERNFCRNMNGVQFGNVTDKALTGRVRNWTFRNNIFHRLSNTMNLYAPGFRFYNNTFSYCYGSAGQIMFNGSTDRGRASTGFFANNIFYKCGVNPASRDQGWPSNNASAGQISASHNLVIGIGAGRMKDTTGRWTRYGMLGNSLNGVEPLFVGEEAINAGNATTKVVPTDFKLRQESPAIGAGKNLSEFFNGDFSENVRPSSGPWDIGAYQYGASPPPPPEPPDQTLPELCCANISSSGSQIILSFNEWVDGVDPEKFAIKGFTIGKAQGLGPNWTLEFTPNAKPSDQLTLTYDGSAQTIKDVAGNPMPTTEIKLVNGTRTQ